MNTSTQFNDSGKIINVAPYGPFLQSTPLLPDRYIKSPNTSKKKIWLEHKGKKVYLTSTHRSKELWNTKGLAKPVVFKWAQSVQYDAVKPRYTKVQREYEHGYDRQLYDAVLKQANAYKAEMKYSKNELLTLAHADANDVTFDMGTFLGELPETIKFLGAVVIKIMKLINAIKQRDVLKFERYFKKGYGFRLVDDSTDVWLAFRYAIMPLIYSLQDGLEALEPPESEFIRTRVRDSFLDDGVKTFLDTDATLGTVSYRCETIARAQVYTILTAEQAAKRRTLLGPFTTAWELIPLSFVVDWVVQVGDFIASFRMLPFSSQGTTYSVRTNMEIVGSVTAKNHTVFGSGYGSPIYSYSGTGNQNLGYTLSEYDRSVVNSFAHEIPIGVRMNTCRIVDAFALSFKIGKGLLRKK